MTDRQTEGRSGGQTDRGKDGQMDEWTDGRMDGWTDGRMDGWTDGWTDGRRADGQMDRLAEAGRQKTLKTTIKTTDMFQILHLRSRGFLTSAQRYNVWSISFVLAHNDSDQSLIFAPMKHSLPQSR